MRDGKKYRNLMADLDEAGINIATRRVGPKWYEVHRNFMAVKRYSKRESANKYVVREHKRVVTNNDLNTD